VAAGPALFAEGRPVPAIRRRAAILVTAVQVARPPVSGRTLTGQDVLRRPPRFVAPGQFQGDGKRGGIVPGLKGR
jgi:hypothetical protein